MADIRDAFPSVPPPTTIVNDIPVSGMTPLTSEDEDAERKAEQEAARVERQAETEEE